MVMIRFKNNGTSNKGNEHVQKRTFVYHPPPKKVENVPAYGCQTCSRFPIIQLHVFLLCECGRIWWGGQTTWGRRLLTFRCSHARVGPEISAVDRNKTRLVSTNLYCLWMLFVAARLLQPVSFLLTIPGLFFTCPYFLDFLNFLVFICLRDWRLKLPLTSIFLKAWNLLVLTCYTCSTCSSNLCFDV